MEDADGFETTGVDGDPEPRSEGSGLRKQLESALREKAALEAKLQAEVSAAEQRGQQRALRRMEAEQVFGQDKPKLVETWVAEHPEEQLTPEAATEFASGFGVTLNPEPPPEPVPPEVKETAATFHATTPPVGGAQATYTPEQVRRIGLSDPDEALRIIQQGAMVPPSTN